MNVDRETLSCLKVPDAGLTEHLEREQAVPEQWNVIDVSLRIPGSPDTGVTPWQHYLFGRNESRVDFGKRIAMEIRDAIAQKRLKEILT